MAPRGVRFRKLREQDQRDVFETAARRLDTRGSYVEKDLWVCFVLDVLYNRMPAGHPKLFFKGGISLSKAFGLIQRFREQLGERDTVSRAARRILRMFVDWVALIETDEKGIYRGYPKRKVDDMQLVSWAIEAQLVAKGGKPQSPGSLIRGPQVFPFDIALPAVGHLENRSSLELTRHGLDHEIIVCLKPAPAYW